MFPSMRHPYRYVWDFWYYFEPETALYHVFYLNADEILVPSEKHHHAACVGHAVTSDFLRMEWGDEKEFDILKPPKHHWANTSIWSGDVIKIKNGFLLFYTSRNREQDDGMTQNIGVAYTDNIWSDRWQMSSIRIRPEYCYQIKSSLGDLSPHAWRDPFLFQDQGQVYMLLSAKSTDDPIGRNGVVGLLKLKENNFSKGEWEYLDPILKPCCYSEMEVPQLYLDSQGKYELVFSSWAKNDFSAVTRQAGGLQGFTGSDFQQLQGRPHVLMPEKYGLYACRVIPELEGEIVGFDIHDGGIRRSGVKTKFQSVNRDFSRFSFELA
ncbi:glycoside hydrolase family protein [Pseudanabaena yagii]|uniref:Beta-fructosidase n=1 Tax=Pseudanabaena yagii GIHE-NHR1 TaxID=2722753 RepID=A0ABX1LNN6_9CYAN|nr:beta-fructosidase [Pseudanabaena yagii]NMF57740.1 beta-fructosidase [Pseudanabaena yagii GIHE-NHR1]